MLHNTIIMRMTAYFDARIAQDRYGKNFLEPMSHAGITFSVNIKDDLGCL